MSDDGTANWALGIVALVVLYLIWFSLGTFGAFGGDQLQSRDDIEAIVCETTACPDPTLTNNEREHICAVAVCRTPEATR